MIPIYFDFLSKHFTYTFLYPMHSVLNFLTTDINLGRVDVRSFSDQMLMEMLFEDFTDFAKKQVQDKDGMFLPVCEWIGVECDEMGSVNIVQQAPSDGPISLQYIPPNTVTFEMYYGDLHGTLETADLPQGLKEFNIGSNKFHGTVDFLRLPTQILEFSIYINCFTGSVALESLPYSLKKLWVHDNQFSGTLCLTKLPPNLDFLDCSENKFSGQFCIHASEKMFHQRVAVKAKGNSFDATAVVPKGLIVHLLRSGVTTVVDEEGNVHESKELILHEDS